MSTNERVDAYVAELSDWRGEKLAYYRNFIHETAPDLTEDWKWDVPIFVGKRMIMAISAFKDHVKINFFHGAQLDGLGLFNSGLDSKSHRSINLTKDEVVDEEKLRRVILQAVALDGEG